MTGRRIARVAVAVGMLAAGAVAGALVAAQPAAAHPLGAFSVNQYAGLRLSPDGVRVDYVVDLAELAAFPVRTQEVDADRDAELSTVERRRYARSACAARAGELRVAVAERPVPLAVVGASLTDPVGTGGLRTLRLECDLRAEASLAEPTTVTFANDAYPDRPGWREVTATGRGIALTRSSAPSGSASARLSAYPDDVLAAPSDVRTATLSVAPSAGATPAGRDGVSARPAGAADRLTAWFTDVVGRHRLTLGVALLGLALAMALGAAHALAPGHGKTVMAALLVGQRGTSRHAVVVAGSVTVTHTAGVLLLGVALAASVTFAPQRLYGALTAASGLLVAVVGVGLLRRAVPAWRRATAHHHHHHHDHDHHHGRPRVRTLLALGFAGGLLPSPSAVVVLLAAVALGRPWYGALLVVGYGVGMAATLIAIGLALSRWGPTLGRRILPRRLSVRQPAVPVLTSALIVLAGLGLTARAVLTLA